jgi:hypothetical protein
MNCSLNSLTDLDIIGRIISSLIDKLDVKYKQTLTYSLPMVNYMFEMIKQKLDVYLKFTMFEPSVNEWPEFRSPEYFVANNVCLQIDLDACIESVRLFRHKFNAIGDSNRLHLLLQLISLTLNNAKKYENVI